MILRRRSIEFQRADRSVLDAPNFYGHMLQEDVRLEVVPIGGRSRTRADFEIRCEPGGRDEERRLARFLREQEHVRDGLTRAVGEFIGSRAAYLVHYGEVYHEIARTEAGEPVLLSLPVGGMIDLGVCALQIKPRDAWADAATKRRWALLPHLSYWHLRMPRSLGGPSGHRRLLATLARLKPESTDPLAIRWRGVACPRLTRRRREQV